ncbi:hypothetical protein BGX26_004295 [Mortierella sp. AD094]|nr:hypothetical protein BGX26_004295 [Mortierella sp. AD094]
MSEEVGSKVEEDKNKVKEIERSLKEHRKARKEKRTAQSIARIQQNQDKTRESYEKLRETRHEVRNVQREIIPQDAYLKKPRQESYACNKLSKTSPPSSSNISNSPATISMTTPTWDHPTVEDDVKHMDISELRANCLVKTQSRRKHQLHKPENKGVRDAQETVSNKDNSLSRATTKEEIDTAHDARKRVRDTLRESENKRRRQKNKHNQALRTSRTWEKIRKAEKRYIQDGASTASQPKSEPVPLRVSQVDGYGDDCGLHHIPNRPECGSPQLITVYALRRS